MAKRETKATSVRKSPARATVTKVKSSSGKKVSTARKKEKAVTLLVGTRKGAFFLRSDAKRTTWSISEAKFLGHIVYHMISDPRGSGVTVMGVKTGHLGPTVIRSSDGGKSWQEATKPPAFDKSGESEKGRAVETVFWITAGHASEPGVWYAGTVPPGLFRSQDHGDTWQPVNGFNNQPNYDEWLPAGGTPGGQMVHSVRIDPRDAAHMYLGVSAGGVFESLDAGATWRPLNKGCQANFLPDGEEAEFGHDPHCFILHEQEPDRLYQQNHCGIYSMDRASSRWVRIGDNMPKEVGDIGFPIVAHPSDHECIWVFPMDGTDVWPRTSPGGKPAVYMSKNGGQTWKRQSKGLPPKDAYFTVKRQAMTADDNNPLGLYFGTTSGEIWGSNNEGESWKCLVRYLPEIYSLTILEK